MRLIHWLLLAYEIAKDIFKWDYISTKWLVIYAQLIVYQLALFYKPFCTIERRLQDAVTFTGT